jgi:hypothetical protein
MTIVPFSPPEITSQSDEAAQFTALCKRLEFYETPRWAADAILKVELMTKTVIDPCCGAGVLSEAAEAAGYSVMSTDIHSWGFKGLYPFRFALVDFLDDLADHDEARALAIMVRNHTVFMNPPFSKAEEFVERALWLGARKVVVFQRFAWWESKDRKDFWANNPPSRVYICGERATCWRHDITAEQRKAMGNTPTAHAWLVWERGNPPGTTLGHVYKDQA